MRRVLFVASLIVALALPVSADPLLITGGSLVFGTSTGTLAIEGERGFTFGAVLTSPAGRFYPREDCAWYPTCTPGATHSLKVDFWEFGIDYLTFNGLTFDRTKVNTANGTTYISTLFTGQIVLPPDIGAVGTSGTSSAPFDFTGRLTSQAGAEMVANETLFGAGLATLTYRVRLWDGPGVDQPFPVWVYESARYDFVAPTLTHAPEPTSLLLLGTGLVGAWRRSNAFRR